MRDGIQDATVATTRTGRAGVPHDLAPAASLIGDMALPAALVWDGGRRILPNAGFAGVIAEDATGATGQCILADAMRALASGGDGDAWGSFATGIAIAGRRFACSPVRDAGHDVIGLMVIAATGTAADPAADAAARSGPTPEAHAYPLALSDALHAATDARAIADTACRLLAARLGADRVDLFAIDRERAVAGRLGGSGQAPAPSDRLLLARLSQDDLAAYRDGGVVRRADGPGFDGQGRGGGRAFLGVPLVRGDGLSAVIAIAGAGRAADDVPLARQTLERCRIALDRAEAEAALRDSEERQGFLLHMGDVLRPLVDPDEVLTTAMRLLGEFLGVNRAHYLEVLSDGDTLRTGPAYLNGVACVPEEQSLRAFGNLIQQYGAGQPLVIDDVADVTAVGTPERAAFEAIRARAVLGVPLFRGGVLLAIIGVNQIEPRRWRRHDITVLTEVAERAWSASERARAQRDLRDSERRLQRLVEGVPQLVWRATGIGEWTWASPQWTALTGQPEGDSHGMGWLGQLHPDDRDGTRQAWIAAATSGAFRIDYRVRDAGSDRYRWFQARATPVRDGDGAITEWLGTSTDIDDIHRLQESQQVLVGELQHRVRNILTVVRSVFSRTIEIGDDLTEVAHHFRGRLDALARTQVIVTRSAERHVDLEDLIRDELLSIAEGDSPRIAISGPEVKLTGRIAEMLGLALHELCTNAVKYGALKSQGGGLRIAWSIDGNAVPPTLDLEWVEQGVPAIPVAPRRRGFGTELIEQALPYRLDARTSLSLHGGGVRCSISIPLDDTDEPGDAPLDGLP